MVEMDVKPFIDAACINQGQEFEFVDEGEFSEIQIGTEDKPETKQVFRITVKTNNIEYFWTMNTTSKLNFIKKYGRDSKAWIGKKGIFSLVKHKVFGQMKDVVYGEPKVEVKK